MTSNTRVVVIGAGLAGVRLARRPGEPGRPARFVGEEGHRLCDRVPLAEVGGVLVGGLRAVGAPARAGEGAEPLPMDGTPLLHLLTNDGGS